MSSHNIKFVSYRILSEIGLQLMVHLGNFDIYHGDYVLNSLQDFSQDM